MNDILKFTASRIKPCPDTLIITPTQTILRLVREELSKRDQNLSQLQLIADSIPLHSCQKFSVLGPVIGKAAINLALHPLLVERINRVILISVAASNKFDIGEIVQGSEFENTNGDIYLANSEFNDIKTSKVLTVDDPYLEDGNFKGCDVIDMEAAEVSRLCISYNKKFNAIFCISDIWQNNSWTKGFGKELLIANLRKVINLIFSEIKID